MNDDDACASMSQQHYLRTLLRIGKNQPIEQDNTGVMTMMSFIWMLIIGLVAGLLARAIKPGRDAMGWVMTIILGIAGAFVGGLLASVLGISADGGMVGLIFSVIGAIILLFAYEFITGKRRIG